MYICTPKKSTPLVMPVTKGVFFVLVSDRIIYQATCKCSKLLHLLR